jgi:hypothetical protein
MASTQNTVVRVEFDRPRKLICKHRHIRDAVLESKKSIIELMSDPFGGYPYLIRALLQPSAAHGEAITIDKASDLIDVYLSKHGSLEGLSKALLQALSAYLHVEVTPTEDEQTGDEPPNAATPDGPGPSAD